MIFRTRFLLFVSLFFVSLFSLMNIAQACRFGGDSPILINGYMSRGYGLVSLVLAVGTIYLQLRRTGLTVVTGLLIAAFVPIYVFNPGWHYSGIGGDCGSGEIDGAYQMMFSVGALLLWQIGAALFVAISAMKSRKTAHVKTVH